MCNTKEEEVKPKIDQLIDAMNRLASALETANRPPDHPYNMYTPPSSQLDCKRPW